MSITNEKDWSEVERKARLHETWNKVADPMSLVTITTEDRLRGAVVEALSQLEQGSPNSAWQVLNDALKIK